MKIGLKLGKSLYGALAGLGAVGIVLMAALMFVPLVASIYGIVLAFKASILLGVIALFVEPAPFVFGIVALFGGVNLPDQIVRWFSHLI